MTIIFLSAMTLGAIGSFHCIGMCGPLAFSLPLKNKSNFAKLAGTLIYNMGRIATYSLLGLMFGMTGRSFAIFGLQQALSIAAGLFILLLLLPLIKKNWVIISPDTFFSKKTGKIRSMIGHYFSIRSYGSLFMIGLLNGLLLCGLVYMAVTGAIIYADPLQSAFFMASFGLGTLPVMWTVSFFGNYIGLGLRHKIKLVYPFLMGAMACLLIVRGMGLDIHCISPKFNLNSREAQICYPNTSNTHFPAAEK